MIKLKRMSQWQETQKRGGVPDTPPESFLNPAQPRKFFPRETPDELLLPIKEHGFFVNALVEVRKQIIMFEPPPRRNIWK
ncbi:MAG: hypothetical protein QW835_00580 [Candidatus Hadarchaeum sp.]